MQLEELPVQNSIQMSPGLLFSQKTVAFLQSFALRYALFCDENLLKLWGEKWFEFLRSQGMDVTLFSVPSGEKQKTRETKERLENALFVKKFGRDTCILAMGGGVVTDLIGFLAATFCRGVPLVNVPTTLMGMVDAAIGGKTGVDTPYGKNLIGAFYLTKAVLLDPFVLKTLPPHELTNGLAEIIKYALIRSPALFEKLEAKMPAESLILECIAIKEEIVAQDFEEKTGMRRILNFGHTIGHALELLTEYRLSHGEAVAIGILVESYMSVECGNLPASDFQRIFALLRSFPFRLEIAPPLTLENIIQALALDKKAERNQPRFVLLERIGTCCPFKGKYCSEVPLSTLEEAIQWMLVQFCKGI